MLRVEMKYFSPRVYSYFDDILGTDREVFNDLSGEGQAINEFNSDNKDIKIAKSYHFLNKINEMWHHQTWITHFFKHKKYNNYQGDIKNWLRYPKINNNI